MAVSRWSPSLAHSWHSEAAEMATIRKRNGRYHVQVRKNGYQTVTKTFTSVTTARKWASGVESDMERRLHVVVPDQTTVRELLKRYEKQILPNHKGQ